MKALIVTALAAILLSGCAGSKINWDSARQVKEGMTQEEVVGLMGSPRTVYARNDGIQRYVWVYVNVMTGTTQSASLDFDKDGRALKGFNVPPSF